ncbi:MAG TPA: site-2 protease family protein [Thermoplasmata archaeon]|nr:site-2 protease family protein [Thermoplasmata archaeon]
MSSNPSYQWTSARPPVARQKTSRAELSQIVIAFVVLTFDMFLLLIGFGLIYGDSLRTVVGSASIGIVLLALAAAFTGFLAHELAHKVVAQRLGFWAEFRLSPVGLVLSVFIAAAAGILLAAPGATLVGGMDYSERQGWGRTALAGPATNAGFSVLFYGAALATFSAGSFLSASLLFLAYINAWFGAFNLVPVGPLDGAKVLRWGVGRWAASFAVLAVLTGLSLAAVSYGTPFLFGR